MKRVQKSNFFVLALFAVVFLASTHVHAQREVHWQINPKGFPGDTNPASLRLVNIFVDVEDRGAFKRDLPTEAFTLGMDEFASDQGGYIYNKNRTAAGWAGAQVLIMIDRSRTYTKEFKRAKKVAKELVRRLDLKRDSVAIATFPNTESSAFAKTKLDLPFSQDLAKLNKVIDNIELPSKEDNEGARFCNSLSEGLQYFPADVTDKYRVVIFLTGGADKGEGKGNCVKDSYKYGKVPFYNVVFKLDRRYDDKRNAHKIENGCLDLAMNTGGRSIFREDDAENTQFIQAMVNRIRSQYHLQAFFPCYKQAPEIRHLGKLKVEGIDVDPIQFEAVSTPAPVPQVTALYPPQVTQKQVDDGNVDLTIDGQGFCAFPNRIKAYVGGTPLAIKSYSPFRVVATINSNVKTGKVKVINYFGQNGESPMDLKVIKPPKGAEASSTLSYLIYGLVGVVVLALIIVAARSRKAKVPLGKAPKASNVAVPAMKAAPAPASTSNAQKTVAFNANFKAWVVTDDGAKIDLLPGNNFIGREDKCRIKMDIVGISREHAKIDVDPGGGSVIVSDLNSTNGTYFGTNDATEADIVRISEPKKLNPGETVWVGGRKIVVFFKEN